MRLLIIGDSRLAALRRGLRRLDTSETEGIEIDFGRIGAARTLRIPFFTRRGGHLQIDSQAPSRDLDRVPLSRTHDCYVFCGVFQTGQIVRSLTTWNTFDLPGHDQGLAPMSENLLGRVIDDTQQHALDFVDAMGELGLPVLVVEPPTPFRNPPYVREVGADRVLAIDSLARRRMRAALAQRGVPAIDVPGECLDPEGFMKPEYQHDRFHGNAAFGALRLRQLLPAAQALTDTNRFVCARPSLSLRATADESSGDRGQSRSR